MSVCSNRVARASGRASVPRFDEDSSWGVRGSPVQNAPPSSVITARFLHFSTQCSPRSRLISAVTSSSESEYRQLRLFIMDDRSPSLPPCKFCPSGIGSESEKQEQPYCDCVISLSLLAREPTIDIPALDTCPEIAAQQECDAQCNATETTEEDLKAK